MSPANKTSPFPSIHALPLQPIRLLSFSSSQTIVSALLLPLAHHPFPRIACSFIFSRRTYTSILFIHSFVCCSVTYHRQQDFLSSSLTMPAIVSQEQADSPAKPLRCAWSITFQETLWEGRLQNTKKHPATCPFSIVSQTKWLQIQTS